MGIVLSKPTLEEQLRQSKRDINRSVRDLDRECIHLENEEKKLILNMKLAAEKKEMISVKLFAKDLLRTRQQKKKCHEMRSHLQALHLQLQTVKTFQAMADSMRHVSRTMMRINRQLNMPIFQTITDRFVKESVAFGITEDMFNSSIGKALENDSLGILEEEMVHQIIDEIGINHLLQYNTPVPFNNLPIPLSIEPSSSTVSKVQPLCDTSIELLTNESLYQTADLPNTSYVTTNNTSALQISLEQRLRNLRT